MRLLRHSSSATLAALVIFVETILLAQNVKATAAAFSACMARRGVTSSIIPESSSNYDALVKDSHITRSANLPVAFFLPETPGDVSKAVLCIRSTGLTACARSGGHSWGASSLCSGVVIDMVNFKKMNVVGGRMTIGAGVTTGEALYTAMTEANRMVPVGTCTSVGYAGYAMGGGIGTMSGSIGLGCDRVRRYNMVLANGSRIIANSNRNTDIFNALCGGGGGHLGIVHEMTLQTVDATPFNNVVYFEYEAPDENDIASLVKDWSEFNHDSIGNTYARAQIIFANGNLGRFRVFGVCWKATEEICGRRLARFRFLDDPRLVRERFERLGGVLNAAPLTSGGTRAEFFTHYDNGVKGNFRRTSSLIWKRNVVEPLSFYQKIVDLLKAGSMSGKTAIAQWSPIGGAVRRRENTQTSYRFRDAHSSWDQYWFGYGTTAAAKANFVAHTSTSRNKVGLYVNYLDNDANVREYYPNGAFQNLLNLKRSLDPDEILEHVQDLESGA